MSNAGIVCPLECTRICENPNPEDFIQKNGAFLLTVIASISAAMGVCFSYFLKSRCTRLQFGCLSCDRDVLPPADVQLADTRVGDQA